MCEITNENFASKFEEITYNLKKANYIGIDGEFTGLHAEGALPSIQDSPQERYVKLKKSVQTYNLIQIGLSTFRYCSEQKIFISDSHNFYLFPRNYDSKCTMQSSAVEFLCQHEFDFNKLTYNGITFMNNKQERQLEAQLKHQINERVSLLNSQKNDFDLQQAMKNVSSEVAEFIRTANVGEIHEVGVVKEIGVLVALEDLKQSVNTIWIHKEDDKVFIEKISEKKRKELDRLDLENERKRNINELLGFTRIFRLLVQFKKPIICHNGFMDFLHLYDKFFEPLPDSFDQFKRTLNTMFPLIYDTKHLAWSVKKVLKKEGKELFESTDCLSLYVSLIRETTKKFNHHLPQIKHSTSSSVYSVKSHPHEAGYDAHMCGSIFLYLSHALASLDSKNMYHIRPNNMNDYFLAVKLFEGKLNMIRASVDHINISGLDPAPRTVQLVVKSDLSISHLRKALSAHGCIEIDSYAGQTVNVVCDGEQTATKLINAYKTSSSVRVTRQTYSDNKKKSLRIIGASTVIAALSVIVLSVLFRQSTK